MIADAQIAQHLTASDQAMRHGRCDVMIMEFDKAMNLIRARRQAADLPTAALALVVAAKLALAAPSDPTRRAALSSAITATESTLAHV